MTIYYVILPFWNTYNVTKILVVRSVCLFTAVFLLIASDFLPNIFLASVHSWSENCWGRKAFSSESICVICKWQYLLPEVTRLIHGIQIQAFAYPEILLCYQLTTVARWFMMMMMLVCASQCCCFVRAMALEKMASINCLKHSRCHKAKLDFEATITTYCAWSKASYVIATSTQSHCTWSRTRLCYTCASVLINDKSCFLYLQPEVNLALSEPARQHNSLSRWRISLLSSS